MTDYHVVAVELPIVYTLDGDHDRDGLILIPAAHLPLVDYLRECWEDGGELLPRLHHTRQRAQLVVDGLARLEEQLSRLRHGPDEDQDLLAELIRAESVPEYGEPEDRWSHGSRRRSHRAGAVRLNVTTTVAELRVALTDLHDTDGPANWALPEGVADDDSGVPEFGLVTLSPQQRAQWRQHWITQLGLLDRAIARWFDEVDADPMRRFDADALAAATGMPAARVRRLMCNDHRDDVSGLGSATGPYDRCNPLRPLPFVEPLVLRSAQGEAITVTVENQVRGRRLGFHVQGEGMSTPAGAGVRHADGAHVGDNPDSTVGYGESATFHYACEHEGVWPINDLADVRGGERGTNVHGLFGVLLVEPPGTTWRDPVDGTDLTGQPWGTGLYVDVLDPAGTADPEDYVDSHHTGPTSFREFTVFIHDEPEIHSGNHTIGEHTVMPLSYRAEPMHNRLPHRMRRYAERTPQAPDSGQTGVDRTAVSIRLGAELEEQFWTARTPEGDYLERVAGEEQHHSSWLFGDPITPILRAYRGDPCRIRLVHAGVKETHVFHLHVHQWRAVAADTATPGVWGTDAEGRPVPKGSQLLDSITIGPQTGQTIEPLYGSGSRQHAVGDIIWHCHLYPHFHHGMWGLWRSYDRLVDGTRAYPDGTPCPALLPLPGRETDIPGPDAEHPGFPWFIDGEFPMKSPPPPAAREDQRCGRRLLLGMPAHSAHEYDAMAPGCHDGDQAGALFVDLDGDAARWNAAAGLPAPRKVSYDIEVRSDDVTYNTDGWHDPRGHRYQLLQAEIFESDPAGGWRSLGGPETFSASPGTNPEPFFPRANHGDIVELRLHNALQSYPADEYDVGQQPVECGLHVHLVKFDPLSADGSATGWNYISGGSCREAVGSDHPGQSRTVSLHRWVVDEEFGPCFFHDHLLANYRQKHGLWSALIAEPHGSLWQRPEDPSVAAWGEPEAVIVPPTTTGVAPFREACLGIGDFVPLLDRGDRPLNPPGTLSGDDDPGSMAVNYRSAPLTHRGDDPSLWFSNRARSTPSFAGVPGDPDTPVIRTYPGEPLRLRLIQGSHEEQHSFSVHGMRWRRDWGNPSSRLVNQQSLGISEAFTFEIGDPAASPYGPGDHLWKCGTIDDLWVGCWGMVRAMQPNAANFEEFPPLPELGLPPDQALVRLRAATAVPPRPVAGADGSWPAPVREYLVEARRCEHEYAGAQLTDPWGLQFAARELAPGEYRERIVDGSWPPELPPSDPGGLVLRARRGEWVRVLLVNRVLTDEDDSRHQLPPFGVEPSPPRLPLEHLDDLGRPDERTISPRVSLHPSLLRYDVRSFDGAYVGGNVDGTVAPIGDGGNHGGGPGGHEAGGTVVHRDSHHAEDCWTELWWYADEALAPATHLDGPGSVCVLQDMADVRNHRHHGLVGALIVEPGDVTPSAWIGADAELFDENGVVVATEGVVFVQDGLRLFVNGHPDQPVPDVVPGDDPEDSGQKGLSFRSPVIRRGTPPHGPLAGDPVARGRVGVPLWLRCVGAGDKPRQHTLTVHGLSWSSASWVPDAVRTGAVSGVVADWAEDLVLHPQHPGDHIVRTGSFRWGSELGVWGTIRIEE